GATVAIARRSRSVVGAQEAQGQSVRPRRLARRCPERRRTAGTAARRGDRRSHRCTAPARKSARPGTGMTDPGSVAELPAAEVVDAVDRALQRSSGAQAIPGNAVELLFDGPEAYAAMHRMIAAATRRIHFEN